jgi:hypothetical protein
VISPWPDIHDILHQNNSILREKSIEPYAKTLVLCSGPS